MIGRLLCRRGRHKWLVFPRPLVLRHPRPTDDPTAEVAGICGRCHVLARWNYNQPARTVSPGVLPGGTA